MKKCSKCKNEYELSNFWKDRTNKDGYACECIDCNRAKQRKWKIKNPNGSKRATANWRKNNPNKVKKHHQDASMKKRQFMNRVKQKYGCFFCKESEICCLDFHHIGNKDYDITHKTSASYKIILDEMAKCIVVCCNCHRKIHFGKLENPTETIDVSEYQYLVK